MKQVCFISGSPDNAAVKKMRINHRIVQTLKTRFRKDKTIFIYLFNRFRNFVCHM